MKKILSIKPKEYLEQGFIGCGGFSVKAILSSFGKDDKESPYDYYPFREGWMSSPSRWLRTFRSYGLNCESGKMKVGKATDSIKNKLDENKVVMLRIGNGYTKSGEWYWLAWQFIGHWISVWGYNDDERVFYIYDSWMPQKGSKDLPVGNVKRPYKDVVRDSQGGFPFWWRRTYLSISDKM